MLNHSKPTNSKHDKREKNNLDQENNPIENLKYG